MEDYRFVETLQFLPLRSDGGKKKELKQIKIALTDPKHQARFGAPPDWFYEIEDAMIQNRPIEEIRRQPLYVRRRFRVVYNIKREAKITNGKGAQPVIDLAGL